MINGNLVIKAGENEDLMTLVKAALRVMDRKFEWCPPFDGFLGLTYDVKKHFGIDNAALPCKRYFENAISDGGGGER
jgi:hypothetical protein